MTAENIESTVVVFDGEVGDVLRSVFALLTQTSASMFLGFEQPEKKHAATIPKLNGSVASLSEEYLQLRGSFRSTDSA